MDCERTWQWMMQALDGMLPEDRERKMLIHLGGCRHCADTWARLQETALLLPETAGEPEDGLVSDIMRNLPEMPRKRIEHSLSGFAAVAGLLMAIGGVWIYLGLTQAAPSGLVQFAAGFANAAISAVDGAYRLSVILLGERWQEATGSAALLSAIVLMCVGSAAASFRMARTGNAADPGHKDGFTMSERGIEI